MKYIIDIMIHVHVCTVYIKKIMYRHLTPQCVFEKYIIEKM